MGLTSRAFINFANGCTRKRRDLNSSGGGVSPKRTNCRLRLLPHYLFSGSSKLILQGDTPGGSSPGDYPFLQESASMRNFFFVYVFPRGNIFSQLSRPFTHRNEFCWLSAGKITFFLLTFLSRSWSDQLRTRRERIAIVPYSCGLRNYLLSKVFPKING